MRFNTHMSLKKIILIGSIATVGLGVVGATTVAKKLRAKRNVNTDVDTDDMPFDFEDVLLKQLDEFVSKMSESESDYGIDKATDTDDSKDEDIEIELDDNESDADSNIGEDGSIIELNDFQATVLGIAKKPLGSAVRLNGNFYIFVSQYYVNGKIFRVYKLSQHQGR